MFKTEIISGDTDFLFRKIPRSKQEHMETLLGMSNLNDHSVS